MVFMEVPSHRRDLSWSLPLSPKHGEAHRVISSTPNTMLAQKTPGAPSATCLGAQSALPVHSSLTLSYFFTATRTFCPLEKGGVSPINRVLQKNAPKEAYINISPHEVPPRPGTLLMACPRLCPRSTERGEQFLPSLSVAAF